MGIGLVAQRGNDRATALAAEIRDALEANEIDVQLDESTGAALGSAGRPVEAFSDRRLVASIGGDGTFLYTARAVGNTPIVGVNLGEVGFLNAVSPTDATRMIPAIYERAVRDDLRTQALPRVVARDGDRDLGPALNEIVVHAPQRGRAGGIEATVQINGHTYVSDYVDGVMVSTPTGSTAYNLSEGGPLLTPAVSGLVVNEMCGRDSMPPLVVPLDATITISLAGASYGLIVSDGRLRERVDVPVVVTLERASTPVRIAGPPVEFFDALSKLA